MSGVWRNAHRKDSFRRSADARAAPMLAGKISRKFRRALESFAPGGKAAREPLRGRLRNFLQGGFSVHPFQHPEVRLSCLRKHWSIVYGLASERIWREVCALKCRLLKVELRILGS